MFRTTLTISTVARLVALPSINQIWRGSMSPTARSRIDRQSAFSPYSQLWQGYQEVQ